MSADSAIFLGFLGSFLLRSWSSSLELGIGIDGGPTQIGTTRLSLI